MYLGWFSFFSPEISSPSSVSTSLSLGGSPSPLGSPHHAGVGGLRYELLHTAQSLASGQNGMFMIPRPPARVTNSQQEQHVRCTEACAHLMGGH